MPAATKFEPKEVERLHSGPETLSHDKRAASMDYGQTSRSCRRLRLIVPLGTSGRFRRLGNTLQTGPRQFELLSAS